MLDLGICFNGLDWVMMGNVTFFFLQFLTDQKWGKLSWACNYMCLDLFTCNLCFRTKSFGFFFGVEFAGTNATPKNKSRSGSGSGSKSGSFYRIKDSGSKIDTRKLDGNAIGYEYPALGRQVFRIG